MKLFRKIAGVVVFAAMLSGCALGTFPPGVLITSQKMPVTATSNGSSCAKKGTGSTMNLLGLFAFGDASIATAKEKAGISKIDTVDVSNASFLGIFTKTTVEVCGE